MEKILKGDWIRKSKYSLFKNELPVLEVISINVKKKKNPEDKGIMLVINGKFYFEPGEIIKISAEEAQDLLNKFNNLHISESLVTGLSTACFRNDTGQGKKGFESETEVKKVLFKYMMNKPNDNFESYQCGSCSKYHIGKRPSDKTIKNHVNIPEIELSNVLCKNLELDVNLAYKNSTELHLGKYIISPKRKNFIGVGKIKTYWAYWEIYELNRLGKILLIHPEKEKLEIIIGKLKNFDYAIVKKLGFWKTIYNFFKK